MQVDNNSFFSFVERLVKGKPDLPTPSVRTGGGRSGLPFTRRPRKLSKPLPSTFMQASSECLHGACKAIIGVMCEDKPSGCLHLSYIEELMRNPALQSEIQSHACMSSKPHLICFELAQLSFQVA